MAGFRADSSGIVLACEATWTNEEIQRENVKRVGHPVRVRAAGGRYRSRKALPAEGPESADSLFDPDFEDRLGDRCAPCERIERRLSRPLPVFYRFLSYLIASGNGP